MDDYISREAAISEILSDPINALYPSWYAEKLKQIPAADVRPVVRARWKAHGDCGVTECPVCRWSIEECINYNFCPYCGADMRKVDADGKS